jgi:hypothetical protein
VGTPLVLGLGPAPLTTLINVQVLPFNQAGQTTPLTNLQPFTWGQ